MWNNTSLWAPAALWPRPAPSYVKALSDDGAVSAGGEPVTGVIQEIHSAVSEGFTRYYFKLDGADTIYVAGIQTSSKLPFYKAGDTVTVTCSGEGAVRDVLTIE